jgi:drug/metabolite transporter (DMT)-like permease
MTPETARGERRGTIALTLLASLLWGLWWLPIRALEEAGFAGVWAGLAMSLGALPALALAAWRSRRLAGRALLGACLIGTAAMLYAAALAFTDVVRAVLLFYLAPAWSTAIECLFLDRRWSRRSALALGLSFAGVGVIFRFDVSLSGWSAGDLAALASGLFWAVGAAVVFTRPDARPAALSLAAGLGMVGAGAAAVVLAGPAAGAAPGPEALAALPLAIGSGTLYLAPILLVTLWAAQRLAPATMSFLLTAEIVAGVVSGALLLDEPFGAHEAAGAALIALGALVETASASVRRPA